MRIFVAITDRDWFTHIAQRVASGLLDANFWRPSGNPYSAEPGELFLFHLREKHEIAGGGFFARSARLPIHFAWDVFGGGNGVDSEAKLRAKIQSKKTDPAAVTSLTEIACNVLSEVFILPAERRFPVLHTPNSPYKTYVAEAGDGRRLWHQVSEALQSSQDLAPNPGPASQALFEPAFGPPRLVLPRLGQTGFRAVVLDAYARRCAITGERTLPVLEAAHIRRYSSSGDHSLTNGVLLRSDLHRLFDRGYLGIHPQDRSVHVSHRIREEFENGRDYYALQGRAIRLPNAISDHPSEEQLSFHWLNIFQR